jgi:hypothetical protein
VVIWVDEDGSDHRGGEEQRKSANDQVAHSLGFPICLIWEIREK